MVSVADPVVLLTVAWLVVLFAAGFRYQWGSFPPARALVVVSTALFWIAFSLTRLSAVVAPPYDDVLVALASVVLVGGACSLLRWWRGRRTARDAA